LWQLFGAVGILAVAAFTSDVLNNARMNVM
jgi:hypothetical protein